MPVPTRITDLSTTASSNSPAGSDTIGSSLDDYLRAIQCVFRTDLASKGADIASAGTTDLGAVAGFAHDITGNTTITSFGTVAAGISKLIKFEGALTLTHNATALILPGGANITTADGDVAWMISEGSGNWRCNSYVSASGGMVAVATQADMEAASSTSLAVTPGRQHYHLGHPKAVIKLTGLTGTPSITALYNSLGTLGSSRTAAGDHTLTWTNSLTNPIVAVTNQSNSGTVARYTSQFPIGASNTATQARFLTTDAGGALADVDALIVVIYGDLA